MGDKVQLKGYVDEDVVEAFRAFIAKKHQRFERGLLSIEMEEAIKFYMAGAKHIPTVNNAANIGQEPQGEHTQARASSPSATEVAVRRHNNPHPKAWKLRNEIKLFLFKDPEFNGDNSYGYPDAIYQVPRAHLVRAIEQLRGIDPRTVKKWIDILRRNGIVKEIDMFGNVVEVH